ncbi:Histidine phosphatase superfamily, clade-2 [Kalmanozyma brasiliensis GHG001]|uniref:Histidine phosphatase superfamily, clade-2 n=1 Tax=Kalmanozyma brasiliensis (strain GHG001) TaxID=1365824 RepID=UPI001CE82720|nr:Histidine phosphatase superfamily, clade-2 [Kalmanozyma brasiliensis GHG001]EST04783.2 Histidine phosphatase superfamily, clade-2 [Kalmanozyma brasiliensis GHG001]
MPAITHGLASVGASVVPTPHLPSPHLLPSDIFHHLGQYSPWFPADTSSDYADPPDQCAVTFVSQLERHGSRYPTAGAYRELRKTLRQIAKHLERVPDTGKGVKATEGLDPHLKWLRRWVQSKKSEDGGMRNRLGNSELTPYGQYEAYSSGWRFYEQYAHLFEAQQVDVNVDYDVESDRSGAHSNPWLDSICAAPQTPAESSAWSTLQVLSGIRHGVCQALRFITRSDPSDLHHEHRERPFVRASGADRVITTSRFWLQGFAHSPHKPFRHASPESAPWPQKGRPAVLDDLKGGKPHRRIDHLPKPDVIIPEARKSDKLGQVASNNTLDVYTCSAFERDYRDNARSPASIKTAAFAANATTAIRDRLASQLGVRKGGSKDRRGERIHLEPRQVLQLFSLCAFDTVARLDPYGLLYGDSKRNEDAVSPFCSLFKPEEYASIYEITTDMEKDYGFAAHNPLHRALATPWLRELLARMEDRSPVMIPPTSINTTLDGDQRTFPVPSAKGPRAFADFTHDNQLAPIISALNLWDEKHTWVTSTTTPFSGRLTVEKLECGKDEYVRILVNGQPASTSEGSWCPSSDDGFVLKGDQLCPLSTFLQPLKWVDHADEWDKCYSKKGKKVESSDASFP